MRSLWGHGQPGWVAQELSTIQINLLRAPRCSDHPGGPGPEVCQGQPEADFRTGPQPCFSQSGLSSVSSLLCVFPIWCVCAVELQVGQRLSVMRFPPLWTWFKQSVKWKRYSLWAVQLWPVMTEWKCGVNDKNFDTCVQHEGPCRITACHGSLEATFVTNKDSPLLDQFVSISLSGR